MSTIRLLCAAILPSLCSAQLSDHRPPPSFTSASILPAGGDRPVALSPGLLMSIYGEHLGPTSACEGHADPDHRETPSPQRPYQVFAETLIYPKDLCETQVLVGGLPAGLQYVQERQINFKVPQDTPVEGTIEIRVIYRGQSSKPAKLPLGLESAAIFLEHPTRVGMPVWLRVSMFGADGAIQYPFDIHPAVFWCQEVEVKRDGKLLPLIATPASQSFDGMMFAGAMCGSLGLPEASHHTGRIPLHLQYRFDQPGVYEVRYTMRREMAPGTVPAMQSAWTRIQILPGSPSERSEWLKGQLAQAPTGTTDLLTDLLPGILGIPDSESLRSLCPYLYHPDTLVRRYAMYGLTYWPATEAEAAVRELVRTRGPSDAAITFLTRTPALFGTSGGSYIEAALPYLESDDPVLLRGAMSAVQRTGWPANPALDPKLRISAEAAVIAAADHIASVADPQTLTDCAAFLGTAHDERAGSILWGWIGRNIAREQAAIAVSWRRSTADLPKLAQLALAPLDGNAQSYEFASLPYALRNSYGDAAIPYLETLLARSEFTFVRTSSARELVLAGRPSGFAFMADAIAGSNPNRVEMIQFLRDQFPDLRRADDAAVLAFATNRAKAK